jgi:hypothetical protein
MRALARVGAGFVDACAPRDQPFSVAHDPYGLERRRMGALLATLPMNRCFLERRLGASRELAQSGARAAARTLLIESRLAALRVLLGQAALSGQKALADCFGELVFRSLAIELPGSVAGAFVRLHSDDAQRFAGLLLGFQHAEALTTSHDVDWFRNPRAIDQLRSEAAMPPSFEVDPQRLDAAAAITVASLGDALD